MKYRFFHIRAVDPGSEAETLNRFLAEKAIVAVDRQFVSDGANSYWAFSISYRDDQPPATPPDPGRKSRVDYREVLDAADFAVYAELRDLRKQLAEQEGVPAYALFTNEQMAEMVRRRVASAADIAAIKGVGKLRVEKYAEAFLRLLEQQRTAEPNHGAGDAPNPD